MSSRKLFDDEAEEVDLDYNPAGYGGQANDTGYYTGQQQHQQPEYGGNEYSQGYGQQH